MGEAKRKRARWPGLERHVEGLRAGGVAALSRLAEDLDRRRGRKLVSAETMPVATAMLDPALGPGTLDALLAVFAAAHGVTPDGPLCECCACRTLWIPERVPRAMVVIRLLEPEAVHLAFLCETCAGGPEAAVRGRVRTMLLRDYLGGEGEEVTLSPEAGTA